MKSRWVFLGIMTTILVTRGALAIGEKTEEQSLSIVMEELREKLNFRDRLSQEVSRVPVEWHIYHSLSVVIQIEKELSKSDPENYKRDTNILRSLMLLTGRFGRGKGKSPKSTTPPELIGHQDLLNQFDLVKSSIAKLKDLHENTHFSHYAFGTMNLESARRFMIIHTKHHLKIVDDIIEEDRS